MAITAQALAGPAPDCGLCPRLVAFRRDNRKAHADWFNGAVPAFGPATARVLVVGLAPGLQGANRTGRPFTGDYAGVLLYPTLLKFGLAKGTYGADPGDGLTLVDCRITNAVRCVPPANKPTPAEQNTCRSFLVAEMAALPKLKAILALGRIAHDAVVTTLGLRKSAVPFGHGKIHKISDKLILADSYHCSRYNVNTGRLTTEMFEAVVKKVVGAANE
ncbi:MAG: uracil-DNA glycosylase [Rhodospirillaceae bacterium]|nr:MAG: uracil-DNA glycosylase [Rhodospirillaceae bacterium]